MNEYEVSKLLAVLAAAFPRFEVDDMKVNVWHEMLGDIPYDVAQVAVKKLILENTFPPSIAEVRKAVTEITNSRLKTAAEAWGEVVQAVHRYGYYREQEALENMSPETARVVRYIGWQEICTCEEPDVIRGQFSRMYEQLASRERAERLLPAELKGEIQRLARRFELKAIEDNRNKRKGKVVALPEKAQ